MYLVPEDGQCGRNMLHVLAGSIKLLWLTVYVYEFFILGFQICSVSFAQYCDRHVPTQCSLCNIWISSLDNIR